MKTRFHAITFFLLVLGLSFASGASQATDNTTGGSTPMSTGQILQQIVTVLASEIRSSVSGGEFSRIAVMPFTSLRGEENDLGLYISDKLTSELSVGEDNLQLVERSRINQALKEMALGETGFLSETTIQKTGQALGADAVIVGSIVELGDEVDITLRVFSVSTLKILGKASQLLAKNEVIESLLSKTSPAVTATSTQPGDQGEGADESNASSQIGNVFFKEDFAGIEEGLFPEGWIGGNSLSVEPSQDKKGGNVLANFQPGKHQFTIPNILFPENWRFELECIYHGDCAFILSIGEIKVWLTTGRGGGRMSLNGIEVGKSAPPTRQVNLITVEKRGTVIKLFVNSEKYKVIRLDGLEPPTGISFSCGYNFGILRLEGTRLP